MHNIPRGNVYTKSYAYMNIPHKFLTINVENLVSKVKNFTVTRFFISKKYIRCLKLALFNFFNPLFNIGKKIALHLKFSRKVNHFTAFNINYINKMRSAMNYFTFCRSFLRISDRYKYLLKECLVCIVS